MPTQRLDSRPATAPQAVPGSSDAVTGDVGDGPWAVGVDLMRGRWATAWAIGADVHFGVAVSFADVLAAAPFGVPVGVDIPIGLPDGAPRLADRLARAHLPGAASRVFPAPARVTLAHADDYAAALSASRQAIGRGLSKQAFHLLPAIADVDATLPDARVVEVHPEVSFAAMSGRVLASKKTPQGRNDRIAAVVAALDMLGVDVAAEAIPGEDHLDALACLWTAIRITRGEAVRLPADDDPQDSAGRPMVITY